MIRVKPVAFRIPPELPKDSKMHGFAQIVR